jgi:hypothetical protein
MIVFDLRCLARDDRFEAWFRSNADFERQLEQGLVQCPFCASSDVAKAPMAPMLPRSGPLELLAELQAELLRDSRWVGDRFAETARSMHLGEIETEQVHGEASVEQARSLVDEGVPIAPLPLPVVPPKQLN